MSDGRSTHPECSRRWRARRAIAAVIVAAVAAATGCRDATVTRAVPAPAAAAPASPPPASGPAGSPSPLAPGAPATAVRAATVEQRIEIVARHPHDPAAFTQGLLLADGRLFESTGLVGASTVREVDLATGRVLRRLDVREGFFAEGLALVGNRLIQLTWQSGVALVHDRDTFAPLGRFQYDGEGWGLCFDGRRLVMSDGSDRLTFRNPDTFAVEGTVRVSTDDGTPVDELNELECVNERVYANVWRTDRIARIDPTTGLVEAWIDASGLRPPTAGPDDVLNGIAFDPADGTFLLTGKRWPTLYRVRLTS